MAEGPPPDSSNAGRTLPLLTAPRIIATQVYILRHGATARPLIGRTYLQLTENGEYRPSRLRARLQGIKFNHVLTSPIKRGHRACELARFDAARVDPDLRKWDCRNY
jgi:broad specificity phosphatase PhoE